MRASSAARLALAIMQDKRIVSLTAAAAAVIYMNTYMQSDIEFTLQHEQRSCRSLQDKNIDSLATHYVCSVYTRDCVVSGLLCRAAMVSASAVRASSAQRLTWLM